MHRTYGTTNTALAPLHGEVAGNSSTGGASPREHAAVIVPKRAAVFQADSTDHPENPGAALTRGQRRMGAGCRRRRPHLCVVVCVQVRAHLQPGIRTVKDPIFYVNP